MGGDRRRKRQEVRMRRHWSSSGLLASLPAAAAAVVASANIHLYTVWTVTTTREEGVERERERKRRRGREKEREATQREEGSGAIAIGLACQQWWTGNCLPGKGELTNASTHPRAPHHSSISNTQAGAHAHVHQMLIGVCAFPICRFSSARAWPSFITPLTATPVRLERLNGRNGKWQLLTGRSQELFRAGIGGGGALVHCGTRREASALPKSE